MTKAVLFDMDGVLAFTEPYYNRRRAAYLRDRGVDFTGSTDFTGIHDDEAWERCVPDNVELRRCLREEYGRYADEHPTPWDELANPQALQTFAALGEQDVRTAICSSSPRGLIEECMDALGLRGLTDFFISGDECVAHKPDPEIYLHALRRLGVTPDETIVVEDSPVGIRAGKAAGALVCALRQPDGVVLDQHEADLVIDSLSEVVSLVG